MRQLPSLAGLGRATAAALGLVLTLSVTGTPVQANQSALSMLNSVRAQFGKPPVAYNKRLEKAAKVHARDMQRNGVRSHTGSNGTQLQHRVAKSGYRYCFAAENIGWGQKSMQNVMQAWMNSSGHRANMLSGKARDIGIAQTDDGIWVMVLGRDGC
jgi:uncharacterized protein YkwD